MPDNVPRLIQSNNAVNVGALWLMLVVALGILAAMVGGHPLRIVPEILEFNLGVVIVCLFALGAMLGGVVQSIRLWRFGQPQLQLESAPVPGGSLKGTLIINKPLRSTLPIQTSLTLQKVTERSAYDHPDTQVTDLWQTSLVIAPEALRRLPQQSQLPLSMAVPSEVVVPEGTGLRWRLAIYVSIPGPDFTAEFDLPTLQDAR